MATGGRHVTRKGAVFGVIEAWVRRRRHCRIRYLSAGSEWVVSVGFETVWLACNCLLSVTSVRF